MESDIVRDQQEPPLIVITGPTASGKTGLAIAIACRYNGEIICADSRTIYKGMDIGTAKPSLEERTLVPHWGLDIVTPGEKFSAADFKMYADATIADIRSRGHVPILVGGTGLYIDSVVLDYKFGTPSDPDRRSELAEKSVLWLQEYCASNNMQLPENKQNKRHLVRAIEQNGINLQRRATPVENAVVVAIATDRSELRTRIALRAEQLFEQGVVEEAIALSRLYGWESEAMTGNIYRLTRKYIEGEYTREQLKNKFITSDWRLAKRQLTWLRRHDYIHWLSLSEAEKFLSDQLAPYTQK